MHGKDAPVEDCGRLPGECLLCETGSRDYLPVHVIWGPTHVAPRRDHFYGLPSRMCDFHPLCYQIWHAYHPLCCQTGHDYHPLCAKLGMSFIRCAAKLGMIFIPCAAKFTMKIRTIYAITYVGVRRLQGSLWRDVCACGHQTHGQLRMTDMPVAQVL